MTQEARKKLAGLDIDTLDAIAEVANGVVKDYHLWGYFQIQGIWEMMSRLRLVVYEAKQ